MDINETSCQIVTKSTDQYNQCNLNKPFIFYTANSINLNYNNKQIQSWTDYNTVGATVVKTYNADNPPKLTIKAIANNVIDNGGDEHFVIDEFYQLDDNSWISAKNFMWRPKEVIEAYNPEKYPLH